MGQIFPLRTPDPPRALVPGPGLDLQLPELEHQGDRLVPAWLGSHVSPLSGDASTREERAAWALLRRSGCDIVQVLS
jgi:hypothetical protein